MIDTLFSQVVFESKINDSAAKKIENLIKLCVEEKVVPNFEQFRKAQLKVKKSYTICNNCAWIKESKQMCSICKSFTTDNHFTLFDIKDQISRIVERNSSTLTHFQKNITELGYLDDSWIANCHRKNKNALTMTLNMDGVSVFMNNSNDTWPIFLAFNELPLKEKFSVQNIVFVGIWCGQTKLNNFVLMNDAMQSIAELEKGLEICGEKFEFYTVFGSFDKPAKSWVYNAQSCTSRFGCMFCVGECTRINRIPVYLKAGQMRDDAFQLGQSIKAAETNKPSKGLKGRSSLR